MIRSAAVLLLCLAGPAQALSCLRPDVVSLYEQARDSEDVYSIVRGRLSYPAPPRLPKPDQPTSSPAVIAGTALGADGLTIPFVSEVTLSLSCLGPWCPGAPPVRAEAFIALRHHQGGYVLDQSACFANAVPAAPGDEERLLACHQHNRCHRK